MSRFSLEALTKDIRERNMGVEARRLTEKWAGTGLLKGLTGYDRENMGRLLENQAAELLRETSSLSTGAGALTASGNIRGFTNVAFPIVRRVFGGLVANDLVSIQPMSLPAGLLFYLDYTYGNNVGGEGTATDSVYTAGQSIYNNPTGAGVRSGSQATGGQYDLVGSAYTKLHTGSLTVGSGSTSLPNLGAFVGASEAFTAGGIVDTASDFTGTNARLAGFDPDVQRDLDENVLDVQFLFLSTADLAAAMPTGDVQEVKQIAITDLGASPGGALAWGSSYQGGTGVLNLRRLNERGNWNGTTWTPAPLSGNSIKFVLRLSNGGSTPVLGSDVHVSMAVADSLDVGGTDGDTLVIPSFETNFAVEASPTIPEIDIKIEQISVVATSRKLRARWSPELAQDLNAFHSLDAEVELTKILSEQVAIDIDREILNDLLMEANGANLYWSRAPGKFVNKETGRLVQLTSTLDPGPEFTGTVREWYETLVETIIDAANTIHRKTLRGSANFVVTSPDVCTILEQSSLYRANYKLDGNGQVSTPFSIGAENVGSLSQRFQVYKDPYFPRNKILLGYKGGTYLETGYVYAPYVPLIVTPTIFGQEDFSPRKGVMTRYGKKMVRSDFYGTVTILDMNII